jgi:hypothetical protein
MMGNMVLSGTSESSKVKFVKDNFKSDFVKTLKKKLKKKFGKKK